MAPEQRARAAVFHASLRQLSLDLGLSDSSEDGPSSVDRARISYLARTDPGLGWVMVDGDEPIGFAQPVGCRRFSSRCSRRYRSSALQDGWEWGFLFPSSWRSGGALLWGIGRVGKLGMRGDLSRRS